jgi:hypothetical protein
MNLEDLTEGILQEMRALGCAETALGRQRELLKLVAHWFGFNSKAGLIQEAVDGDLNEIAGRLQSGSIGETILS